LLLPQHPQQGAGAAAVQEKENGALRSGIGGVGGWGSSTAALKAKVGLGGLAQAHPQQHQHQHHQHHHQQARGSLGYTEGESTSGEGSSAHSLNPGDVALWGARGGSGGGGGGGGTTTTTSSSASTTSPSLESGGVTPTPWLAPLASVESSASTTSGGSACAVLGAQQHLPHSGASASSRGVASSSSSSSAAAAAVGFFPSQNLNHVAHHHHHLHHGASPTQMAPISALSAAVPLRKRALLLKELKWGPSEWGWRGGGGGWRRCVGTDKVLREGSERGRGAGESSGEGARALV